MADGNLVRQSGTEKGAMVFGPDVYDVPLLPYEKELIKTIGITEEEYRRFAAEVRRRGVVRPAEYDHIPDIQNEISTTAILVSIAISLITTGVSYLLMPKPKTPSAPKRGSEIDTGSLTGPSRFTPTRGFETLNELADYNAPIPIVFGLYQGEGRGNHGGGIFVTPKLVWSRMFSYGTQQSALMMFVIGEQGVAEGPYDGMKPPELEGIFLGNNALDPVHEDQFAFYWLQASTTSTGQRIKGVNKLYGTQGTPDSGNPNVDEPRTRGNTEDILLVPDGDVEESKSFCHAYSPANLTEFGAYSPIANGNGVKVQYEVIPIGRNKSEAGSDASETKSSQRAKVMQRVKIVGDLNRVRNEKGSNYGGKGLKEFLLEKIRGQDQTGTGREYSPRMGLVKFIPKSGSQVTTGSGQKTREVSVTEGDKVEFLISDTQIDEDVYKVDKAAVSVDDINSLVRDAQIAADEQMQLGEVFAIAGSLWKVISRSRQKPFAIDSGDQRIILECIDTSLSTIKKIGIVDNKDVINPGIYIDDKEGVDCDFYPLMKMSVASFKNNRAASVTEIGIKSTVFQRLNGLTAINGLPTPREIKDFGREKVTVTTGTANITIRRASAFRIAVKKANSGDEFHFLKEFFVVIGSKPIAQYHSIQIRQFDPTPEQLEFKIIPLPGSELKGLDRGKDFVQLRSDTTGDNIYIGKTQIPGIGFISVRTAGTKVEKSFFSDNPELGRAARLITTGGTAGKPETVSIKHYLPQEQVTDKFQAESIDLLEDSVVVTPSGATNGAADAFNFALAGDADAGGPLRKTTETTEYYNNKTQFIKLRWNWIKLRLPDNHYARVNSGQRNTWKLLSCQVIGSSAGFPLNHRFEVRRGINKTNDKPLVAYAERNIFSRNVPGVSGGVITGSGYKFKVSEVKVVQGGDEEQAYFFEKFGSAANRAVGTAQARTVTETVNGKAMQVELKVKVANLDNHPSGERKGYRSVSVLVKSENTGTGFQIGDEFQETKTVTVDNPFAAKDLVVGARFVVTEIDVSSTKSQYEGDNFEPNNGIADISFYRDRVQKSNDTEPESEIVYVNEIVPNTSNAGYSRLTTAALSLKASRAFTRLDQMRLWLPSGLKVKRLHPKYSDHSPNPYEDAVPGSETFRQQYGPSNLFTDLVYYLLTDNVAGAGGLMKMTPDNAPLVDTESFQDTSVFLEKQKLFFNGVITDRTNVRQFVMDLAPNFLCHFIITDGKFGLIPAVPFNKNSGNFNTGSVKIDQLFTSGNILEDSFSVEYLRAEDRRPFTAVVRYRGESENKFPEEKAVIVFKKGSKTADGVDNLPQEHFDFTQFCTSKDHAVKAARYFLAIRELVTHTIKFSTTVFGLNLKAGSFIKVITESNPYSSANNGTIDGSGNVTSVTPLGDGQYNVLYFSSDGGTDVKDGTMTVSNGKVAESKFHNSVFTLNNKTVSNNIYIVEQLTFSEEGTVDIVASEHPCEEQGGKDDISKLALAIVDSGAAYQVIDV